MIEIDYIHNLLLGSRAYLTFNINKAVMIDNFVSCANNFEATIIGEGNANYVLIGLHERFENVIGWETSKKDNIHYINQFREKVGNLKDFKYAWMVPYNIKVGLIVDKIISPDQICCSCKKPAPHTKPNKENNYICNYCSLLLEFG